MASDHGFIIVLGTDRGPMALYAQAPSVWTTNREHACRFVRREDAARFQPDFDNEFNAPSLVAAYGETA